MRRIVFLILIALPPIAGELAAREKDRIWTPGAVRVLNTDQWCGPQRDYCCQQLGAPPPFVGTYWGGPQPPNPTSQILEIDGPDAIYIVKRTSVDGGLRLHADAVVPFSVEGKYLLIRVKATPYVVQTLHPEFGTGWEQDRLKILEIRKK